MPAQHLRVTDLTVRLEQKTLLNSVTFEIAPGDRVGVIGGSGSGKTLTALAICGLLPLDMEVSGSIRFGDTELLDLSERERAQLRGDEISMVFQEPKTALDPLRKLGIQMTTALTHHYTLTREQQKEAALRLAQRVGFDQPERMVNSYPHEVSGGQRQRAAIAAAIAAGPSLLLADEPTTALDVTVEAGVLRLLAELTENDETSLLFISHDLAVVSQVAERVLVMHEGSIIESGSITDILRSPQHSVTTQLIEAAADHWSDQSAAASEGGDAK